MTVGSLAGRYGVTITPLTKQTDTVDASGGRIETWTEGSALTGLMQVQAVNDGPVGGGERRVRSVKIYFDGVLSLAIEDRLKHGSTIYDIRSIRNPDERPAGDRLAYTIVEAEEVFS